MPPRIARVSTHRSEMRSASISCDARRVRDSPPAGLVRADAPAVLAAVERGGVRWTEQHSRKTAPPRSTRRERVPRSLRCRCLCCPRRPERSRDLDRTQTGSTQHSQRMPRRARFSRYLGDCCQKVHQPFNGEAVQLVVPKRRHLGLRNAQHLGRIRLRELPPLKHLIQRISEPQLGLTLGRVWEPQVGEYVAGAANDLPSPLNVSTCHTVRYASRRRRDTSRLPPELSQFWDGGANALCGILPNSDEPAGGRRNVRRRWVLEQDAGGPPKAPKNTETGLAAGFAPSSRRRRGD